MLWKTLFALGLVVPAIWAVSPLVSNRVDDPVACATCKAFVTRIDEAIANNEEDIITNVLAKCPDLMPTHIEECQYMVSIYGEPLLDWIIASGADAEQVCTDFGQCGSLE